MSQVPRCHPTVLEQKRPVALQSGTRYKSLRTDRPSISDPRLTDDPQPRGGPCHLTDWCTRRPQTKQKYPISILMEIEMENREMYPGYPLGPDDPVRIKKTRSDRLVTPCDAYSKT